MSMRTQTSLHFGFCIFMPKKNQKAHTPLEDFRLRLAQLRRAKGLTQRDLAKKSGLSQRMIAYYEKRVKRPPANVLPLLAKILGVSIDELLGLKGSVNFSPKNPRVWKKIQQINNLPPKEQKAVAHFVEALLAKQKLAS